MSLTKFVLVAAIMTAVPVAAMTVTKRIPGADGSWDYASVDPASNRLFVARADGVMTVDLATGVVVPQFVPGARVHAAFIIPGQQIGVSTNGTTNSATLFDARSGRSLAEIKTGAKPDAATWDPATKTVWTMNGADGSATIIDPVAGKAVGSMQIGGALEFAVTDGRGHLYVNVEDKSELATIDTRTREVIRRTRLTGCEEPSGLALTAKGTLIAACANGVAKVVDAKSGHLLSTLTIGLRPDAVLSDPVRNRAYIPSGGDGTLAVIDISSATPLVIGTVPTQRGARTGAVDPATGIVYLPTARTVADGAARQRQVSGSFEILMVTP